MKMKRYHIEGHIYYITTNVYARRPIFTRPAYVIALIDSLNFYRHRYTFKLIGYVIMPDHIHLLVWPQQEANVDDFMRDFKKFTAIRIIRQAKVEGRSDDLQAFQWAGTETGRSENKVWQDSYWDKNIYSDPFLRQKLNYIHRNPVRAQLVANPVEYPYSSYRNYVAGDESLIEIDRGWS